MNVFIGTASWNIPKHMRERFPVEGSVLERYAKAFNAVEINSSFYRDHRPATYRRWADSVPNTFKFSIKLSKVFTHDQKLNVSTNNLHENIRGILELGNKLGCLLVQLPPRLEFSEEISDRFFAQIRKIYSGKIALEPRHLSWTNDNLKSLNSRFSISPVIADPNPLPTPIDISDTELVYFRLHGAPIIYKSDYTPEVLASYCEKIADLQNQNKEVWCIFDNTTFGHATQNALSIIAPLQAENHGPDFASL